MNRKPTAAHPNDSVHQKERPAAELTAELARANEQLVALRGRLVLEREKCRLSEKQHTDLLRFEDLMIEISAHFVNLPVDQIDAHIEDAQRRICECLDLDLSSLWQWSDSDPTRFTVTHLHRPPEFPEIPEKLNGQTSLPWVFERIQRGEVLLLSSDNLPPEAARDQEMRVSFGVKSSVVIPLIVDDGALLGVLAFDTLHETLAWPEFIVMRLKLIAQVFTHALARKQAEARLESRRRFEALVVDISTQFVNLPADQIDLQIEEAQRQICECLDVDLSALWQWSDSAPDMLTLTHLHSPPEGPERPKNIYANEAFPWSLKKMYEGKPLVIQTESLPPEAAKDQEMRRFFGVKTSVGIPLSVGTGSIMGFISFDNLKEEQTWSESVVKRLQLIGQIFANALARKRSDFQLRESRERLSMATDAAGVGLWVMEADTGAVWATPQTKTLFHFVEDEALDYASFDRMIDPADRKRVEQAVQATIQSDEKLDIEFRVVVPDENVLWIKAIGKKLSATNGSTVRLMGASIDITDRKQMEDQLRMQLDEINVLKQQLEKENIYLRKEIELKTVHKEIVGRSPAMLRVLNQVEQVAQTDTTVLIQGETGTGKELLARAVHQLSGRRKRHLVTVNCASLPPALFESELFGREKGAYTGAMTQMTGRFELADGATLFLDEIGELPFEVQAKLLRVLEQGCFERLGSTQAMKVDVRIIAATNQDLAKQVAAGKFRKDLYYRLNVFPICLPPLRERPEDIPPLVLAFVRQYENIMGKRINHIPRQCMDELRRYAWPGNIRELRNVVERAMIVSSGRALEVHPPHGAVAEIPKDLNLEQVERQHIIDILQQTGWHLSGQGGAADILGLKRTTLYSKMKKLGIRRPPKNV